MLHSAAMADFANITKWQDRHYGPRMQSQVVSFLLNQTDYYNSIRFDVPLDQLYQECHTELGVSKAMTHKWWLSFNLFGELPYETAAFMRRVKKKYGWLSKSNNVNDSELQILERIVDRRPDLHLDKIALRFGLETGKYLHFSTIWKYITTHLGYSLQSLTEKAAQQCEIEQAEFLTALTLALQDNPELIITVDETHRDRNASRRRRGYRRKNNRGLQLTQWFKNCIRYTMIGVADVNGFIPCACSTYLRDELSEDVMHFYIFSCQQAFA